MKKTRIVTIVTILTLAVSGPVLALKVIVDHSEKYDFSQVETVAWGEGGVLAQNELNQGRIDDAIQQQLREKGFTWVEDEKPDLVVITYVGASQAQKKSNVSVGVGVSRRTSHGAFSVGGSRPVGGSTVTQGTLRIDLLDAESGDLVWRADCSDTISGDGNKMEKKIRKAVERAFKDFPPGQGKKK